MSKNRSFYKQYHDDDSLLFSLNHWDFKLYKLIQSKAVFSDEYQLGELTLKKGQWLRSYSKIQKDLTMIVNRQKVPPTIQELRCAVKRLCNRNLIRYHSSNHGILFELVESHYDNVSEQVEEEPQQELEQGLQQGLEHHKKNIFKKNEFIKNEFSSSTTTKNEKKNPTTTTWIKNILKPITE